MTYFIMINRTEYTIIIIHTGTSFIQQNCIIVQNINLFYCFFIYIFNGFKHSTYFSCFLFQMKS